MKPSKLTRPHACTAKDSFYILIMKFNAITRVFRECIIYKVKVSRFEEVNFGLTNVMCQRLLK
jgi:hypothetical protein